LLLQPLLGLLVSEEKTISDTNACCALNVLLSAGLVFVSHVHNRCGLASVRLLAENTFEVLLNFGRHSSNSSLLPRTVLSIACSFTFHETRDLGHLNRNHHAHIRFMA